MSGSDYSAPARCPNLGSWVPRARVTLVGAAILSAMAWVAISPVLEEGFWFDDYSMQEMSNRPPLPEFLANSFIPGPRQIWYRPMELVKWRIEYSLFRDDAFWYHLVQNSVHVLNCLLLMGLVARLSRNWRVGFVAGLVYSTLPAFEVSVFSAAAGDIVGELCYLTAIWVWVSYLEEGGWLRYGLVGAAFLVGLLSKEVDVTIPIVLLLVDRWVVARPARPWEWIRRVLPFFAVWPIWATLEWSVIAGKLAGQATGGHWASTVGVLTYYFGVLGFPWATDALMRMAGLAALVGLAAYSIATRRWSLLFAAVLGPILVLPMFSSPEVNTRYLYIPLIASAVLGALAVEGALQFLRAQLGSRAALVMSGAGALLITLIALSDSVSTGTAAESFSALARQARLQFRPIFQEHLAFEPGTLLYFVDPPMASYNISGMMFLRYGAKVEVSGDDVEGPAELQARPAAYVFYPDDQGVLKEQQVLGNASLATDLPLPVRFGPAISLDGFEAVNTQTRPGEAIVLILYWRALGSIDRDYTVFAHLLDRQGAVIAGADSQPHQGSWPTTRWLTGHLVEDAVIIPITPDVPPASDYRVEVGLYYQPTMERLPIMTTNQNSGYTAVTFSTFRVGQ